jgi:hypothetical protein
MVERRTVVVGVGAVVLLFVVALAVVGPSDFFLPERATAVDEGDLPAGTEVLKRGTFVGTNGYDVSGEVTLLRDAEGLSLRFENYDQTQGPDVFVYVTPDGTPETSGEVRAGTRVPIDGGADDGESTKVGTFTQRLPDGVTAADVNGVGIWCERFATAFGYATLAE